MTNKLTETEFDMLEQVVAIICDCSICQDGNVCERVKTTAKRIRRIKMPEQREQPIEPGGDAAFEAWWRSTVTNRFIPSAGLEHKSFLAGYAARGEKDLKAGE